jgi:hypothetical protein
MTSIPRGSSVNDLVQVLFFELEVGNVHGPDRVQRSVQSFGGGPVRAAQLAMQLPQRAQYPRAIEPLSLAVLAEAHRATPPVLYKERPAAPALVSTASGPSYPQRAGAAGIARGDADWPAARILTAPCSQIL